MTNTVDGKALALLGDMVSCPRCGGLYPLTKGKLRSRFDKAKFQFRDLRARGVTHRTIDEGLEAGQRLAGHSGPGMTVRYVCGARPVKPSR